MADDTNFKPKKVINPNVRLDEDGVITYYDDEELFKILLTMLSYLYG